jgi:PAS domain S-box-containing protein
MGYIGFWLLFACCRSSLALNPSLDISQYGHDAWTIREGFFRGVPLSIAQTADGYLWVGTEFGLVRFDGVRPVPWAPPGGEPLPSQSIYTLLVARDGTLWIGTTAGLASWNGAKLTRYPDADGKAVWSILEDHEGTVWVGGGSSGTGWLCGIRASKSQCYGQDGSFGLDVTSLCEDSTGNLWVGTGSGLWLWKPGRPERYAIPESNLVSLLQEDDGDLLIGTRDGITRLVNGKAVPYRIRGVSARNPHMFRDRDGSLWIGASGQGLMHMHRGRTDVFSRLDGLSADEIRSVFEDREGNIWVATDEGIDRFHELPVFTVSARQGLSTDEVFSVLAAKDGSVWLGGRNGLNWWKNGQVTTFRKSDGLPDDTVQWLFQDDGGRIWAFSLRGLAYFADGRFVPVRCVRGGLVSFITGDQKGGLWVSADQGLLHVLDGHLAEQIPWPRLERPRKAQVLAADRQRGGLWLGFLAGGVAYFKDGQIQMSYTTAQGLGSGAVSDLRLGREGALWAATEGGLSVIKHGLVATLTSKNGLPCATVRWSIEADDQSTWLYMPCGLIRIAPADLEAWMTDPRRTIPVSLLDGSDGARTHQFGGTFGPRVAKAPDGKIWFSGLAGVSVIDPGHLPVNKLPPPVHIESIKADGKPFPLARGMRLPAKVRDVWIDYTALSFVAPDKVHFKYKLDGQDRDWREVVNERKVQYSNLGPRTYVFRVMASNNSGVWNETGDTLEFSVAPAFYQTTWFRALTAAAVLVLMGLGYQLRVWRVQRESRRLRDVIETIPAYVWSAQPDGSVDFVNRRWLEFSGFPLKQALGWGWADALHPEDRARMVEGWQAAVASGNALEAEARMRGADGEYRWLLFRSVPQRDRSGKIVKWYGKSMDITEIKRAEEERERMHELEADLAHMNRVSMMGELSASIAHEVNQPLTGIVSNGSACLRWLGADGPIPAPDAEEVREAVRDIVRDGKRAGEIIRRIRALTKRTELPREKLDLNETIREVLALVGDEAKKNSVTIRTQFADEVSPVHGDRVQLQQVLLNLIMNAIQAMSNVSDREHQLVIATQNIDQDQVQVTLEDSGTGLAPEKIAKIFEPFYTTKSGGMGMGLSICRSLLQNHGGRIWAAANERPGASFHFTLPKCKGEKTKAGTAAD